MTTFDREWQDGDDSAMQDEAYEKGFAEGADWGAEQVRMYVEELRGRMKRQSASKKSALESVRLMHDDMRLMFFDLAEALREELEVHDEPSQHLVESVGSWALRLHELGLMSDEDKAHYFDITGYEGE